MEGEQLRLRFSKPYKGYFWDDGYRAALHRALKARRQAIRRKLRCKIIATARERLTTELSDLAIAETQFFGVIHRETALPLDKKGRPFVPKTARGKLHVPLWALPLNARGKRHVPSPREIVARAAFARFVDKGNLPMALAKLAAIDPERYHVAVAAEAAAYPAVRRALNRVGSDVKNDWPPAPDELLVLENFYATTVFRRPLMGISPDHAVFMIALKRKIEITSDRYRRILRKFQLSGH